MDGWTDLLLQVLHVAEALEGQPQQGRAVARGGAGLLRLNDGMGAGSSKTRWLLSAGVRYKIT